MKLGAFLPYDRTIQCDGKFSMEKVIGLIAELGIPSCGFYLDNACDEQGWSTEAPRLSAMLERNGLELAEYSLSTFLMPLTREECPVKAETVVNAMAVAESIGCLNVVASAGGFGGSGKYEWNGYCPHPDNRSPRAWELLRETCGIISELAASRQIKARLLVEPTYSSAVWNADLLGRLVDETGSPNVLGHIDFINLLSFDRIYDHSEWLHETFQKLSGKIYSAHIKDLAPIQSYCAGVEEKLIGKGVFDLRTYLDCLSEMPEEMPVLIEHLASMDDVRHSYCYLKNLMNS